MYFEKPDPKEEGWRVESGKKERKSQCRTQGGTQLGSAGIGRKVVSQDSGTGIEKIRAELKDWLKWCESVDWGIESSNEIVVITKHLSAVS